MRHVIRLPPRHLDLGLTLRPHRHGAGDPTCRLTGDTAELATRTPEGPGALRCLRRGDLVEVEGWGPGGDWLGERAEALLGLHDDPARLRPQHPAVATAARRHPGLRISRSGVVWPALAAAVLGQRITTGEAHDQWRALCRLLGGPAPGPLDLVLPPDPVAVADAPYWWFHRLGVERRRADTLRAAARVHQQLQAVADGPPEDAYSRWRAVPGLGPWTLGVIGGPVLGDPDAVPVGDAHLPHAVGWALAGRPRSSDAEMLELLAPYAGQRGRVLRLLVAAGWSAPRFGPRRRVASITAW